MAVFRRFVQQLTRSGSSITVTIPRPVMFQLKLKHGDPVALTVVNNSILLTPCGDTVRRAVADELAAAGLQPIDPSVP